ncbi:hypothetical protein Tco_1243634 [Tanacetum coccineum]
MSIMNDDLFTYEVEISGLANVPCDLNKGDVSEQQMTHGSDNNMEYDPTNVEFTEWLASKFYNHKTIDHYTKNELWIYWTRGGNEVELTDEESSDSDDEDEVAEIFRIDTNIYEEYKDDWIYEWNKDVSWVHWKNPLRWKEDDYCNGGNLPGAYIVRNRLRYQDLEWHEALKDSKLKEEALKNKAIMEGIIDEDDESSNEGWRRWDNFENTNRDNKESEYKMEHEDEERCELFDDQERLVCNIRRFETIKYSFGEDEEYVVVKENEYDDLTSTSKEAIHAYQEIFRMMDEGWMVTRAE